MVIKTSLKLVPIITSVESASELATEKLFPCEHKNTKESLKNIIGAPSITIVVFLPTYAVTIIRQKICRHNF